MHQLVKPSILAVVKYKRWFKRIGSQFCTRIRRCLSTQIPLLDSELPRHHLWRHCTITASYINLQCERTDSESDPIYCRLVSQSPVFTYCVSSVIFPLSECHKIIKGCIIAYKCLQRDPFLRRRRKDNLTPTFSAASRWRFDWQTFVVSPKTEITSSPLSLMIHIRCNPTCLEAPHLGLPLWISAASPPGFSSD